MRVSKTVHMGDVLSFLWEWSFIVTGQGCHVRAQDRNLPSS